MFGNRNKDSKGEKGQAEQKPPARQTVARDAYCRICKDYTHFSKCWLRMQYLGKCTSCQTPFSDARALYAKNVPACPQCGEFLEQPGFEYGLCDQCGSKYEFVEGAVPSMLPNKKQRDAMEKFGRSRSVE